MNLSFFIGNGLMKGGGGGVMEESIVDNGIPSMYVGVGSGIAGGGGVGGGGSGSGIDPELWHACAGQTVQLPRAGSRVIYFAQGHAEHASSPPPLPPGTPYAVACAVASVHYLADLDTDEVFARIRLRPLLQNSLDAATNDKNNFENGLIGTLNGQFGAENGAADNDFLLSHLQRDKLAAFAKTLTQSDANNGGGFSVPRYCAESIFPKLDYAADPPVQSVLAKDVHGIVWKFRHIYRGTPRRHLLTTGWSNFVNQKRLVAGDSIVFLRNHAGELCVGVRRSVRGLTPRSPFAATHHHPQQQQQQQQQPPPPSSSSLRWDSGKGLDSTYDFHGNHRTPKQAGFRHNPGRVSPQSVVDAVTNAASGKAFEVVYYPRGNMSEFCVRAHVVKRSLQHSWAAGMRFKMPVETDDSSRVNWFLGTISKVQDADQLCWPDSPWKMLQVTWDEPDLLHSVTRVSPWQIELVSPVQLPPFALAYKKLRVGQPSELQLDNQEYMGLTTLATLPWNGFEGSPVGSQGTRHDQIYFHHKFIPNIYLNNLYQNRESPGGGGGGGGGVGRGVGVGVGYGVSTEMNSGNVYNGDKPTIPNGKNYSASLIAGNAPSEGVSSTNISKSDLVSCAKSASSTQFMLFGKSIVMSLSCAPEQKSVESSPEGPEIDTVLDGGHPEELINVHRFLCSSADMPKHVDNLSHGFYQDDSQTSATHGVVDLKCFKEDKGFLDGDKDGNTVGDNFLHCKIFRENEEVGRTVDLSSFSSYGELCKRLARMFQIDESKIWSRVIYMDPGGLFKQIGGEPYMDFMKRTRRLKILADSSDEALTG